MSGRDRDVTDVACPTCNAGPGQRCVAPIAGPPIDWEPRSEPHRLRVQAWAELAPALVTVDRGDRWARPPA
jgi:hypothetical protein